MEMLAPRSHKALQSKLSDVGRPTDASASNPPSPPSGPMTRARAKALHDKVNSLLATFHFDTPLDGMLLTVDTLCVVRYIPQESPRLRHPIEMAIRCEERGPKNQ